MTTCVVEKEAMKFIARAAALSFALLAIAAAPARPPTLDAARQALTKAITAHDWTQVGNLTAWPLAVDNYGSPPALTKAQYLKDHRKLTLYLGDGDKDLLHCVATAPLAYQGDKTQFGYGSWLADCNGNEFYFGLKGGKALLTAYQNINE
jgi:hypothetical protein